MKAPDRNSDDELFTAIELARRCGKGAATIHDYRSRSILQPVERNGRCHYSLLHVAVVAAVDRLKNEFRLRKSEIVQLAKRVTQQDLAKLKEMSHERVAKVLRQHRLPASL